MSTISKKRHIAGWVLTGFIGFAMSASAAGKLSGAQPMVENFAKMHLDGYLKPIAVLELVCALLFVIPKTQSVGVLLVTGYFGGAIVAHLAAATPSEIVPALVLGAIAWTANFLKNPQMFESLTRAM